MPDESQSTTFQSHPAQTTPVPAPTPVAVPMDGPSELELLIHEAEASAQRDNPASTNTERQQVSHPCQHTDTFPSERKRCRTCGMLLCPMCWSPLDPEFCRDCLSDADATLIEERVIVDVEGVKHEGRVLHPDPQARFYTPKFGTLAKTIAEMDDNELTDYIKRYQDLVRQAERALDFRRVVLGSSQLEQSQRNDVKRRALRADKTKYTVHTLTLDKTTGKVTPQKKTVNTIDVSNMVNLLAKLRAVKETK